MSYDPLDERTDHSVKLPSKLRRAQEFFAPAVAYVIHKGITYDFTEASIETVLLLALYDAWSDFLSNHTNIPMHRTAMSKPAAPSLSSVRPLQENGSPRRESAFPSESVAVFRGTYFTESRQDFTVQDDRLSLLGREPFNSGQPRNAAVPPIPLTLILNVGREFTQLNLRELVLRARGYVVESALSPESAINCFRQGDFDLILVCHSISLKDRDEFICSIRAYGSRVPIVCLPQDPNHRTVFDNRHVVRNLLDVIGLVTEETLSRPAMGATVFLGNCDCYCSKTPPNPKAILCIHDNQEFLKVQRRLLGDAGYLVLTTQNCVDCLNIFSTGVADAVVLSYWLPTRNGGVLATQMRQKNKDIPLIAVSGTSTMPDVEMPLFDHIIPKSGSPQVLPQVLNDLFKGRPLHVPIVGQ